MKQYESIKDRYSDCIVFFRLGDFYEMFGDDAVIASKILQITLTTREKNKEDPLPMCGVPFFAAETYISRLVKEGFKVAICEQVGDPKESKGVVEREVVRVITPGTHTPEEQKANSYIISLFPRGSGHGMAAADLSTGEFFIFETDQPVADELSRFEPREVLLPRGLAAESMYSEALSSYFISPVDDYLFDYAESYKAISRHFGVASLDGFGMQGHDAAVCAAGALLAYLRDTQGEGFSLRAPSVLRTETAMFLDLSTQRNLEVIHNLKDGSSEETLLWALDETLTPMGGRFLRNAVIRPLKDVGEIRRRLDAVSLLHNDYELTERLRARLRRLQDIERLAARVEQGSANARDLVAIKNSVEHIPSIKKALLSSGDPYLKVLSASLSDFSRMSGIIESAIVGHPPMGLREGGIIREGFHKEIDELRSISTSGKDYIATLEAEEKRKTGISSLKVGYNKIFGYYIEVTKANLDLVPADYIRKQTLVSGERFITPKLKEYESKVLGAEERLKSLELEIFMSVLKEVAKNAPALSGAAEALAIVDFLASLAVVAKRHDYVMPHIDESPVIKLVNCRHPVLERLPIEGSFIPNDVYLDGESYMLLVITGPNMAGKSTYMRQAALCVLMAQIGSFVPAEYAAIGIVDRIFTRIGASDFLTKGQSTFMVEMIETANILNNATDRSLIILDEVGRGTSTFDGISIAWATAEYIAGNLKAKTLFATHYNELTELGLTLEGVKNFNVSVKEWGDEIIFLRKIEKGSADKSYGIQVARLAGLPDDVVKKAKSVLENLETQEINSSGMPRLAPKSSVPERKQLDLFGGRGEALLSELLALDIKGMSKDDALKKLKELRKKAETL